jgi:hypothetical protein
MNTFSLGIDSLTHKKIVIEKQSICPLLLEMVHLDQLEQKYGGNQPNLNHGGFWPPSFPSEEYGVDP